MFYFKTGSWLLLITFSLHTFGHFAGGLQATNDTEKQLLDLMINYKMQLGSDTITMMGLQKGFSLCFSILFLWSGSLGLYLSSKKVGIAPSILRTVSIFYALILILTAVISITYFFLIPTLCIVICLICFALASLRFKG